MAGKADIVAVVAQAMGTTKVAAADAVEAVVSAISTLTETGDSLALRGFGTFKLKTRAARTGRNPQTGAAIDIPAKTALSFRASK